MPIHTSPSWQNLPLPGSGTALSITPIAGMHAKRKGGFPALSVIQVGRETQERASTAGQGVHTRQQAKQIPVPPTHPPSVLLTQEAWCEWSARVDSHPGPAGQGLWKDHTRATARSQTSALGGRWKIRAVLFPSKLLRFSLIY